MDGLIRAATDFLAAVFGALGFIGRPRRRAGISADLDLLDRLRDSHAFGPESTSHRFLVQHISLEVAKLAKVELTHKKKIPWGSVIFASVIGIPLGFWTYRFDHASFHWLSLFPGAVSTLMLLAVLGMLFDRDETPAEGEDQRRE
jgi:hypothetical protein